MKAKPEYRHLRGQKRALQLSIAALGVALLCIVGRHAFGFHPHGKECLNDWLLALLFGTPVLLTAYFLGLDLAVKGRRV